MSRRLLALFVVLTPVLLAQIDSNSISIVASRSIYLQPDQVTFFLSVTSGGDATLNDIVNALAGAGVTPSDYLRVDTFYVPIPGQGDPWLQNWSFSLGVPFSRMKETVAALTELRQTISKKNGGLQMSFNLVGLQVSPQLLASQQCSNRDLVADARAHAEKLASAVGFGVGYVLSISKPTSAVPTGALAYAQLSSVEAITVQPFYYFAPQASSQSCSLQVEFAVIR
jgi:hypothetical protein